MATDRRLWFKVDVDYLENPKVAELVEDHPRAIILHLTCIAWSKKHGTDGRVPMRQAMRWACATQCDLDACIDAGLLDRDGDRHVEVHDYLKHQTSAKQDQTTSDKARRAAKERWGKNRDASSNAPSMPDAMRNAMQSKSKSKSKDSCSSADAESDFNTWWKTYPRKVGKGQAARAYKTAAKKVHPTLLLEALTTQLPSLTARGAEYCPYPATWLNGERWDDEPASNVHQLPSASDEGASWMSGGA